MEVATAEPCLNCTCSRGTLLCYLRICPKLPNPPPPGCILLHRYRTCCPELICTEIFGGGNELEARSEPDGVDISYDRTSTENACVANGSIYGPGSAMDSSSLCEYCYCLRGNQICVKPKCLLPIDGCVPMYEPTNCCPIHYNCTYASSTTSSTTTIKPQETESHRGGCVVDDIYYNEGGKVLGVGHSACDNCYCLRGILRCEPLSCAPPLFGCTPVVRSGECCAASYNCSGAIEIQPEPNYGEFPIVSKEYAKLRKQFQQKIPDPAANRESSVTEISNLPFYVIAETSQTTTKNQRSPGTSGTTRHFTGISFDSSTKKPLYYNSMREENLSASENRDSTRSYVQNKFPDIYYATTNTNYKRIYATTIKPITTEPNGFKTINSITTADYKEAEKLRSVDYLDLNDETLLSIVDSLLDSRLNRRVETKNDAEFNNNLTTENTESSQVTTSDPIISTEEAVTETTTYDISTTDLLTTTEDLITASVPLNFSLHPVTLKTILNSTDCVNDNETVSKQNYLDFSEFSTAIPVDANEVNKLAEVKNYEDSITSSEESPIETTTNEQIQESKIKIVNATFKSPLEIEAILNITKNKDQDYEFDYNESSLPPSLPNLKIIPFVAADALDSEKDTHNVIHQDHLTDTSFGYMNLFSPPTETEGGFIPKQPPILENFYENAVTSASITNTPKLLEASCISEGSEVAHGQSITSESACITCSCYYGNIVCQKITCPIPAPGCRKASVQDLATCCPHYICGTEEAPTVVLDRLEGTLNSQEVVTVAEGVNTPDPFRDVIRTEPAPDLQSLIVDMMPFLARKTTPIPPTTEKIPLQKPTSTQPFDDVTTVKYSNEGNFVLDKVLQLIFSNKNDHTSETTSPQIQTSKFHRTADPTTTVAPSVQSKTKPLQTTPVSSINTTRENSNNKDETPNSGIAILKLAGCNIYGRMYRVGRIISELSNPCLECKCTEIGVQCRALKC
ncbi:hypothetical protein BDFB_004096 [Asbolus verrucosus]|uniref:VWFC domain-containing protein n=1 Tax=Asbolus verrucosus TaxID=1661398 RepID=A0A482VUD6_ASBVE|nr:hypothetical protein BDFB_004096 [Asbolus verrucosus]